MMILSIVSLMYLRKEKCDIRGGVFRL
jgi:hypothetical protein